MGVMALESMPFQSEGSSKSKRQGRENRNARKSFWN